MILELLDISGVLISWIFLYYTLEKMPKLIDNYVLNRKIGAGQYGEVFRGYDRATNNEIAVKSIQRDKVKGTNMTESR